ncbi:MAG: serine hydrolase domain-containing protein [Pseudomonadota bacterium]
MKIIHTLFAAALLVSQATAHANTEETALGDSVDAIFADLVLEDAPGAGVIVAEAGEPLHELYYGKADLVHGVPIGPDTVFHVASVSKQFTAYAINRLALDGSIDLDATFQTYLPDAPDYGAPITVRQLIHHTSGLRSHYVVASLAGKPRDLPLTPARAKRWPELLRDLNYAPGTETSYTNLAYGYLAEIVEAVSGESLPDWLQANVFTPLDMRSTLVLNDYNRVVPGRATSFRKTEDEWEHTHFLNNLLGGTNVNTTPRDLAKWAAHLVSLKQSDPDMWSAMTTPGTLNDGSPALLNGKMPYAGGLALSNVADIPVLKHGGSNAQYRAYVMLAPESGLFVAILSNTTEGGAHARIDAVMRAALVSKGLVEAEPAKEADETEEKAKIAFDLDAVAPAMGAFTIARAALPEDLAMPQGQNLPTDATMLLRAGEAGIEMRVDSGIWAPLEAVAPTIAKAGEGTIDYSGSQPTLQFKDETTAFARGGCSATRSEQLVGRYKNPAWPVVIEVTFSDLLLQMTYGEDEKRGLICASKSQLLTEIKDNTDFAGAKQFETVGEGIPSALDVSLGQRARRVRFERID